MIKYTLADNRCDFKVGSEQSAGLDLRIYLGKNPREDATVINPGETKKYSTGVKVQLPEMWVGIIVPRSSLGKKELMIANTVGVIDSDYRGEIMMTLHNYGKEPQILYNFDRVAQLVVMPHYPTALREKVDSLDETERGEGGFGHSGIK